MGEQISHRGRLLRWTGSSSGAWFFLTIDGDAADALSATALMRRLEGLGRGFGSLRVLASVGDTCWQTSVFPQKGEGWLLPVKAAVRRAEDLCEGDEVDLRLEV